MSSRIDNLNNFEIDSSQVQRISPEKAMNARVGDVFLVRSPALSGLSDHFLLIIGGLVQKAHGLRPESLNFPADKDTPLSAFGDELVILALDDTSRLAFYDCFEVESQYRRS